VRFVESSRQCLGMASFRVETSLWGGWGGLHGDLEKGGSPRVKTSVERGREGERWI